MKEKHLQIGSKENFEKALIRLGVEKEVIPTTHPILATSFYGLNVIENKNIPQNQAWLIDKDGKLLQVFSI